VKRGSYTSHILAARETGFDERKVLGQRKLPPSEIREGVADKGRTLATMRLRAFTGEVHMHHISKPQDQARILAKALKELNLNVKHQDALEVVAKVMGHKNWKTMSAAYKAAQESAKQATPAILPPLPILGPEDGYLFEGCVTIDVTMSADVVVRAHSKKQAQELLPLAAKEQFPRGFANDDGNFLSLDDFYLGDESAVENLSKPEFENDGDHYGRGDWKDERYEYAIHMSRDNPDSSDDDERADVSVTLVLTSRQNWQVSCKKDITDYQVQRDDIASWIEECVDEGDFDEDFDELKAELEKKLQEM
jgi:hypothetical protein